MLRLSVSVILLFVAFPFSSSLAQNGVTQLTASEAESRFNELVVKYNKLEEQYNASKRQADGRDWLERFLSDHPMNSMTNEFLDLEKSTRCTKVGFSCLYHLTLTFRVPTDDLSSPVLNAKQTALKRLSEHYADYPVIDTTFRRLFNGPRVPGCEDFLREMISSSSLDYVKANSMYELASYLGREANRPAACQAELFALDETKPNAKALRQGLESVLLEMQNVDVNALRQEAMDLAGQLKKQYSKELVPPVAGAKTPEMIDIDRKSKDRESIAGLLPSLEFEIKHGIGREVPALSGVDVAGNRIDLRNFRGKVVVLFFSYKGCGPCERMYPENRVLIEELKDAPFQFIGIHGDESKETIKESIDSGDITWRVLWDDSGKSVTKLFNVREWPGVFVLDQNGILRGRDLRGQDLARVVKLLLKTDGNNQAVNPNRR